MSLLYCVLVPSEARLYPGSIEIFRRRRQPEVGLKTSISQQWSTGSLSDWQAWKLYSLVPRPFPAPVLIACSIKTEGKAWEKESRAWRQVDVRVDVRGGRARRSNSQTLRWSASSLPNNELYWRCISNVTVSSSWTRYYRKDLPEQPYLLSQYQYCSRWRRPTHGK